MEMNFNLLNKKVDKDLNERKENYKILCASNTTGLNLIADGDSWFDYPLYKDTIDLIPDLCTIKPNILKLAHWGDTTMGELGIKRIKKIQDAIESFAGNFDGILFSGGGNDIAGDQFQLWLNEASVVNHDDSLALNTRFDVILSLVQAAYQDLIELRNKYLFGKPIFINCYDFPIPTNIGVCGQGPWLYPSLLYKGWVDMGQGAIIIKNALIKFSNMLKSLADNPANNIVIVSTQGTLQSNEWANELHPTPEGFGKIAGKFKEALVSTFLDKV